MSFNDVTNVKGNDQRIYFQYVSKDYAISIMSNSNKIDKNGVS